LVDIVTTGIATICTLVVVVNTEQPPDAATVYVTVYVPAVLVLGIISPVEALIDKPAGAE
jgi:hypothetical protein